MEEPEFKPLYLPLRSFIFQEYFFLWTAIFERVKWLMQNYFMIYSEQLLYYLFRCIQSESHSGT